ncbi:MAG: carboxypeptidase regulatory-like domain-containing protein [Janthinobacterium lividum]
MKRLQRPLIISLSMATSLMAPALAQTFRGGINGSVTDGTGSVVTQASITTTDVATGQTRVTTSSSSGDFLFQDLPLGTYTVLVAMPGFATAKYEGIVVSAGTTYTLPVKLAISSSNETVEVAAAGVSLDTTTVAQTTNLSSEVVNDTPINGRDFTQLISVAPGFGGYSANGFGSVNGSRANQVNWQIDGVDNNDLWHNIPAVNQGGVQGIAGTVLPLDSIDEYSQQTQSTAEAGRNPGGVVNVVTKSGTNTAHGSVYYFNRNEFFSANSPFADGLRKQKLRNQNYGASVGGPVVKDRLFFFTNYEKQQFIINTPATTTEPTTAFQADSTALLSQFGLTPTSVATNSLAAFYPAAILNCSTVNSSCDSTNNYTSQAPFFGYSYNAVGKIDYTITPKHSLALRMFGGQGNQSAYVGTYDPYFFETAPIRVFNWSAVVNSSVTQRFSNQVLLGVNYFNQFFFDANHTINPIALGFNTGTVQPQLSGAPGIKITGFDNLQNATPPSGRNDVTGQVTDTASYSLGKHQLRFSFEFRRGYVDEFYHRKTRGNFSFPGTQGPWGYVANSSASNFGFQSAPCQTQYGYTTPTAAQQAYVNKIAAQANGSQILSLADFLIGCTQQAQIVRGNTEREVYVNNFSGSVGDAFQVAQRLNLNYGIRYDFLGPMHNSTQDLSVFRPNLAGAVNGLAFQGAQIGSLFPSAVNDFSPRVGFSFNPAAANTTVLRAGFGMFFDQPNLNPFLDNRPPNGGASGAESNPGGPSPVSTLSATNIVITPNKLLFPTTTAYNASTDYNLFSISPNLRPSYTFNFNLNVERSLGPKTIFTLGYVGSQSHKLLVNHDINQASLGSTASGTAAQNLTRPYGAQFPNYGTINEVASIGNSNYNSLQTTLKTAGWHHLSSQFSYTWAHGLDILTQYRNANLTNSLNPKFDYGNMDYDTRHAFIADLVYDLPNSSHLRTLTNGFQLNSLVSFHSGQPYSIYTGTDTSGTGEGEDRVNVVAGVSPYAGTSKSIVNGQVQWITSGAYALPTTASFGSIRRNQNNAPGYGDIDLSVFKNNSFEIHHHALRTQLRAEMFNLFNRANLAPPDNYLSDGSAFGTITQTIGYYNGAPGIGPGEPFNVQLALKILF